MNTPQIRFFTWATCLFLGITCHTAIAQFQTNQSFVKEVLRLVNQERNANNLGPLNQSSILDRAAQSHSLAMARDNFFAHCNPDTKSTPSDRVRANNYPEGAGENIAVGYATPQRVMDVWMASPGHRRNILNASYKEIGIGYVLDPNDSANVSDVDSRCNRRSASGGPYRHYWTQNFGSANTTNASNYTVGGSLSGLGSGKNISLQNNGADTLTINNNGRFTFATTIVNGSNYSIRVSTQPNGQTCNVNNGSGTVNGTNVSNINVTCTDNTTPPPTSHYSIGGSLNGLNSGNKVVLRNNGIDTLTINANGRFTFSNMLLNGANYVVRVSTQPNGQTCTVKNGSGKVNGNNIIKIGVNCTDNTQPPPPASSYNIGGSVSGLGSGKTLVLRNNSGDDTTINTNGGFTFATTIDDNAAYTVSIARQPEGQTCTINNNSGTVNGANVTNVAVSCTDNTAPETAKIFNGLSGSWYDPTYDGSGFNLIQTSGGFLMYFYGYKGSTDGDAQWLLSEIISDPVRKGQTLTTNVFSGFTGNGGNFTTKPTSPRSGLTDWGQAQITINSCSAGVIKLTGDDGTITHNIVPLAPIDGLTCTETETETNTISYSAPSTTAGIVSGFSGSWYDPAYNGSGFNLVQTTGGLLIYFYGYKGSADGDAQWLLSEVINDPIRKGETLTTNVFSGFTGNGGDFTTKPTTPRSGLTDWGQAQITINSCAAGVIQLTGNDGMVTHNIVPLAMINGVNCTE